MQKGKVKLTQKKAENTPAGGVLVGKKEGQTMIYDDAKVGGWFVGKTHKEGGIQGINKSTGQPIEVQSGEVIITAPALADQTPREFQGKMMTNREILSKINVDAGGVAFAEKGMEIPKEIKRTGATYKYGGKTMTDHEIYKFITGGHLAEGYSLREIASIHQVPLSTLKTQVRMGMKAESEHTSNKREQMKIVKDHLFENPKYYTLLKKAGLKKGGEVKESLIKDAKDGNTPARDLNNYNDMLDVQADGQVGGDTGLFEKGGITPYDANMDGDSADMIFARGGQTLSAEVFEWDKVPTNYRKISKVKKVTFTNNPMDKGLDSIVSPFLGKDDLNPKFMGINFDENGITATNAHILITLPYPNEKYNGIYDINKVKKQKSSELLLINENYPKYENVIRKSEDAGIPYLISVYKLLQYTKSAINYANQTTYAISYKFGDNEAIGFNGKFLIEVLTTALKLGHEKIYVFIHSNNMGIILTPNKDYELGNDEILLTMPVMLNSKYSTINGYGTEDIDYGRSLKVYYDFNDDEIHNADGSIAEFKMEYTNNLLVDDKYLALLSKITNRNNTLPILNYVKVENGIMRATDLDIDLIVKDVNMQNGVYEIYKNAPIITMQPIEDFPKERIFNKNEVLVNHNGSKPIAFEFVTFSEVFEFYLEKLLLSVGKDELRPVMSGICIKKTSSNELFLTTTNAQTLCKINITEYCEFENDDRELEYILPIKYLKDFIKLSDGSLHFKCNLTNIFIEADNLEYVSRAIDGKYPNYQAVIPIQNDKMIVFDHSKMNNCLKSKEVSDIVSKYKADKSIFLEVVNEGNNLYLKVVREIRYNVDYELIEKIKLCEIDFNYNQVETNISVNQSLFLLMPVKDDFKENQYFAFRKQFFDVMLETITDTEIECYFSEQNRAYVFPIDAIDYKKTLPLEKTKQQSKKIKENNKAILDKEKNDLREAIETLIALAEIENDDKERKDIYEAIEILNMIKEQNFANGGEIENKLIFTPIKTPLI